MVHPIRIVQCHGCFRLLHYGHLKHLQYARSLGDLLVVTITADKYIKKEGPIIPERHRSEMLMSLKCVDNVIVIDAPDAIPALEMIKPHIYVKGLEYAGNLPEKWWCDEHGVRTVFYSFNDDRSTALLKSNS